MDMQGDAGDRKPLSSLSSKETCVGCCLAKQVFHFIDYCSVGAFGRSDWMIGTCGRRNRQYSSYMEKSIDLKASVFGRIHLPPAWGDKTAMRPLVTWPLVWRVALQCGRSVEGSANVELTVRSFSNPSNRRYNGLCCRPSVACNLTCDVVYIVCFNSRSPTSSTLSVVYDNSQGGVLAYALVWFNEVNLRWARLVLGWVTFKSSLTINFAAKVAE